MNRRVARRREVGRPRSGRPLPDIAGDVVEAVPVWRKSLHRRCPVKAVGPKILPRESAVPGVGHDATVSSDIHNHPHDEARKARNTRWSADHSSALIRSTSAASR